jgi:cytoskeleton-associated protein 5
MHISDDFYAQLASLKWSERKQPLDILIAAMEKNPKLDEHANYSNIVNSLKNVIAKDSNILVVASACKCLTLIVNGLRTKFTYTKTVLPVALNKLKEKKAVVLTETRVLLDALGKTGSLELCLDDIVGTFAKPSPDVRTETAQFLQRYINIQMTTSATNKNIIKRIVPPLAKVHACARAHMSVCLQLLTDPDAKCRDGAAQALGAAIAFIGKQLVYSMIGDVQNDTIKMEKVC